MLFLGWQNITDILVSNKTQSEEAAKTMILAVNKKNKLVFQSVKQVRSWVKNKKFPSSANHSKESISPKPFELSTRDQYKAINHIRERRCIAQCPITQWLLITAKIPFRARSSWMIKTHVLCSGGWTGLSCSLRSSHSQPARSKPQSRLLL